MHTLFSVAAFSLIALSTAAYADGMPATDTPAAPVVVKSGDSTTVQTGNTGVTTVDTGSTQVKVGTDGAAKVTTPGSQVEVGADGSTKVTTDGSAK